MDSDRSLSADEVRERLAALARRDVPATDEKAAAVALVLFAGDGGRARSTVLTRRTSSLRAHPGQWALPGGRMDPGESPEEAARREVGEELGLVLGDTAALGRLDDFVTVSGYHITPVVLWSEEDPGELEANPDEVASLHVVGLEELDVDALLVEDPDLPTPVLKLPFRGRHIHAPTGAFLHQFREVVLHGRTTRVHHVSTPRRLSR